MRPTRRATVALATLLLSPAMAAGAPDVAADPVFRVTVTPGALRADGVVATERQGQRLAGTAARWAPGKTFEASLEASPATPSDWWLIGDLALRAAASLETGSVTVTDDGVTVDGVTSTPAALDEILRRLDAVLRQTMRLDSRVASVGAVDEPFGVTCRHQFHRLTRDNRVAFVNSGADLRSGAQPLLDRLTELLVECPDLSLTVVGHTDDSGDPATNAALSLARARSVVDYLRSQGIPAARLDAEGAGSSNPLASNDDLPGRRVNRRVEFRLESP